MLATGPAGGHDRGMNAGLSIMVTLSLSLVSGIAVWGPVDTGEAATTGVANVAVPRPAVRAAFDTVNALVGSFDGTQAGKATVGATATSAVMLRAAARPAGLDAQRGLPWTQMTEPQRALTAWLLHRCAESAGVSAPQLSGEALDELSFASAGSLAGTGAAYFRLHAETFVVEMFRADGGAAQFVWRDFGAESTGPWLGERVAAEGR